jgi:hypothetical protein
MVYNQTVVLYDYFKPPSNMKRYKVPVCVRCLIQFKLRLALFKREPQKTGLFSDNRFINRTFLVQKCFNKCGFN